MSKRILVADDSDTFRSLEQMALEKRGYQVYTARNGAEALRITLEQRPDLIVLDMQMPVMDGGQALYAIKTNDAVKMIPIIVVTTIGRPEDEAILRKAGADDFLSKPVNTQELLRRVEALVGR